MSSLQKEARKLAKILKKRRLRIVFAESCTGGLVSQSLSEIPGISEFHCGSAVVYRNDTKASWLGVSRTLLQKKGAVSEPVAAQMAKGVLKKTPEADLSAAVTGHLGPGAPKSLDGCVYYAVALRTKKRSAEPLVFVMKQILGPKTLKRNGNSKNKPSHSLRIRRQQLASHSLILMVRSLLEFEG